MMMEPDSSATENRFNRLLFLRSDFDAKVSGEEQPHDEDGPHAKTCEREEEVKRGVIPSAIISKQKSLVSASLPAVSQSSGAGSARSSSSADRTTTKTPPGGTQVNNDGTIRVPSGSGFRIMVPFPWRLHEILEEVEEQELAWIVSWLPDGRGFRVHCQKSFSEIIIPMFFRHSRYKSFQRQLYLYGFRSLETQDVSRGAYYHPKFIREDRSLCKDIVRVKTEYVNYQREKSKCRKRKQSNATGHASQPGHHTTYPPFDQHPAMVNSLLSSSALPTQQQQQQQHTQGRSSWNNTNTVPSTHFSNRLLKYSEDIIGLFKGEY